MQNRNSKEFSFIRKVRVKEEKSHKKELRILPKIVTISVERKKNPIFFFTNNVVPLKTKLIGENFMLGFCT